MRYPFKYPVLYGELAMQGKTKKGLADRKSTRLNSSHL